MFRTDSLPVSFQHAEPLCDSDLVLTDAPTDRLGRMLHDLRVSVMDRCNLRCSYCMPSGSGDYEFAEPSARLSFDETIRLVRIFAGLGVRKLRITGGEPLLRRNLADLIRRLSEIPELEDIALTTNGVLLPGQAQALADAGLARVTVSLDSVDEQVLASMNGARCTVDSVLAGIRAVQAAGLAPAKINVVVRRGVNDHVILELLDYFRGSGNVVRLIEYMDAGTRNHWRPEDVVSAAELLNRIHARWPVRPLEPNYVGEVARRYEYEDGAGEIGFITSISQPFCGDCHRARLSTEGVLYTCLFARNGLDLREPLRTGAGDDELKAITIRAWRQRGDRYSELRATGPAGEKKVEMYKVGG
jgi:cyclic pyranopterin phosphate synthase